MSGKRALGSVIERLERRSRVDPRTGCINWTGSIVRGYGLIGIDGKTRRVHIVAWEAANGPVPKGTELDHRCHSEEACGKGHDCPHRSCLNVAHLEPVTHGINVLRGESPSAINARKTHCLRDHEFTDSNTRIDSNGGRVCRTCHRARNKAGKARRRARLAGEQ